ncbi:hypothetical protein QZH41_013522 [Actinostola sp. cb2023]|nr:hypothetical protein QZH41_013522 [Actinostola sp. cb2023]
MSYLTKILQVWNKKVDHLTVLLQQGFETKKSAKERMTKNPQKPAKSHYPKCLEGNLHQLLEDIHSWPQEPVNWSEKARFYKLRKSGMNASPQNRGQILNDYLKQQGIDITPFENFKNIGKRIRRAILKQKGGEISIPIPRPNNCLKKEIRARVESGYYDLGVPVLEKHSTKLYLKKDNSGIERRDIKMTARKYPLGTIRRRTLKSHSKFIRTRTDDEYKAMTREQIVTRLEELHENANSNMPEQQMKDNLLQWRENDTGFSGMTILALATMG